MPPEQGAGCAKGTGPALEVTMEKRRKPLAKLGWFVLLYAGGVLAITTIGYLIRLGLGVG